MESRPTGLSSGAPAHYIWFMDSVDIPRLLYLALLGAAIVAWFFAQNRESTGKLVQQATVWGLIFAGVIAAVGLWEDIRRTILPGQAISTADGRIVLPRSRDGHYYLTAEVNGAPIDFVVDTGATRISLTRRDAERAGIDLERLAYVETVRTANGSVRAAPVMLDSVSVGPIVERNLRAGVGSGTMHQSLLGMNYLGRYSRVEIRDARMILER